MARSTLSADLEFHILHNYPWSKLPTNIKQVKTLYEFPLTTHNVIDGCFLFLMLWNYF